MTGETAGKRRFMSEGGWKIYLLPSAAVLTFAGCMTAQSPPRGDDLSFFDAEGHNPALEEITAEGRLRSHELLKLAMNHEASGDTRQALENLKTALKHDPANKEIRDAVTELTDRMSRDEAVERQRKEAEIEEKNRRAEAMMVDATAAASRGESYEAYRKINAACQEAPWNKNVRDLEKELRRPAAEALMKDAEALMAGKRPAEAYAKADLAVRIDMDRSIRRLGAVHADAARMMAAALQEAGRRAEERSLAATAAMRYRQAAEFYADLAGLEADKARAEAAEGERLRYLVVAGDPRLNAGRAEDAGRIERAYRRALEKMTDNPYISVVTEGEFERKRAAGGVGAFGRLTGTFRSVQVMDIGPITSQGSKEEVHYRTEVRYISVTSPESLAPYFPDPNAFGWSRYRGILREMEERRLSGTPGSDIMPVFVPVRYTTTFYYPVYELRRYGDAQFALTLIDGAREDQIAGETVAGSWTATDTYIKPVPEHGIAGHESELPPNEVVEARATDQMIGRLEKGVRDVVGSWGNRFLAEADRAESLGDAAEALENYLLYARAQRAAQKPINGEVALKIAQATGFSFNDNRSDPWKMLGGFER